MQIGLVGKPSSGKSTFFKSATLADVEIANYPFVTIKPNHGVGFVSIECADKEFKTQCNPRFGSCQNHERFVPIDMIDVAGLVVGAHEGKGMGSEFLDDLNQADALIHIIDISGSVNDKGEPCKPLEYDPVKDVKFLETELDMWYLRILKKGWDRFKRQISQEKTDNYKSIAKQMSGVRVTEEIVKDTITELKIDNDLRNWNEKELKGLARMLRIKTKPMIIAANKVDVIGAEKNLERIKKEFPEYIIIPCSAVSELALKEAEKKKAIEYTPGHDNFKIINVNKEQEKGLEYIKENVLKKFNNTGVQKILNTIVFDVLKYKAIFPGGLNNLKDKDGNVLPDCFLLPENSTALDFAFKLHTDIGKGFIKAIDVKKRTSIGKDITLKHGDVIEIKTSA
ncbi:MAG: redox-regulated ATPase YchF [Nanoarchaeota archaeon]